MPTQPAWDDLVSACQQGDWDCAQVLIEGGIELEGRNQVHSLYHPLTNFTSLQDGQTPLFTCCLKENIEMVRYLISRDVNIQAVDNVNM